MSEAIDKRVWAVSLLLAGAVMMGAAAPVAARPQTGTVTRASARPAWRENPGRTLNYQVGVRFRPLLFWIGRDNVGEARIRWVSGPGREEGVEFLGGIDPSRAPRRINRWGYLRETDTPSGARVFGLMTQSDEQTLEQVERTTGRSSEELQVFKVIHGSVAEDHASAGIQKVALSRQLTFRDLDTVLSQVPGPSTPRSIEVPAGTEPGFCLAMTSLLHENVDTWHQTATASPGARRTYVHAAKLFTMTTRSSRMLRQLVAGGREYRNVLESEFESRRVGGTGSELYRIVYGTEGALRDVPIRITYRRNWWFEIEAVLAAGE